MGEGERMLSAAVSARTEIWADCIPRGPDEPDCHTDAAFAAPELVKPAIQAEREGFDAIAIYCFNNAGLEALREKVQILVIAPGQALCRLFDGKAGGLLCPGPGVLPQPAGAGGGSRPVTPALPLDMFKKSVPAPYRCRHAFSPLVLHSSPVRLGWSWDFIFPDSQQAVPVQQYSANPAACSPDLHA